MSYLALTTLLAAFPGTDSLLGLLLLVAIACVVIWGIYALLQWAGIQIPPPVRIIFICLVSIVLIVLLFRAVGMIL